jgi:hypothetical protein
MLTGCCRQHEHSIRMLAAVARGEAWEAMPPRVVCVMVSRVSMSLEPCAVVRVSGGVRAVSARVGRGSGARAFIGV